MCNCDIVCRCDYILPSTLDSPPVLDTLAKVKEASVGACLLGKTRPQSAVSITADQLNLFNISNEYRSYAYTLSPMGVGIMAGKSRDQQYKALKRLHGEVLSTLECSYIITIEVYPGNDNHLHCHGLIRFRSHKKKEDFKKLLKDKITLSRKGNFPNLIDCEFVNSFDHWSKYIVKSQESLLNNKDTSSYLPFVKIDYSFHIPLDVPRMITIPVSERTFKKKIKDVESYKNQLTLKAKALELRLQKLNDQILSLE